MEVSARFAAEKEEFSKENYTVLDTEAGKLYLPRNSVRFGDRIELDYWKFLWMDGIQIFGVDPVA